ncbi:MAG: hypothetical protein WC285_05255 [Candidatus Gracilibacteria bacterium]|jgi:hypothetical protein
MLEKFGTIKNPLTIIAIFAGIAEISGTFVLPFIDIINQNIFIWFLIIFPSSLVAIFFATLNFNHKVLYSPSDYKDEGNFVKTFKFDYNKLQIKKDIEAIEKSKYEISITNFSDADKFIKILKSQNFLANLYLSAGDNPEKYSKLEDHAAIWLGSNVPASIAVPVIKIAKKIYPHLKYIHLSSDMPTDDAPDYIHDQIFIGGSTSSAIDFKAKEMSKTDFNQLDEAMSEKDLHSFIRSYYC